ncbi:MAG: putative transglutaminase-like cysteine proteinase [Alphaproteobacteria bacterium]|jgi:predicted transglutaminase-like cysteine proteinase
MLNVLLFFICGESYAASGLFGSIEFKLGSIEALPKWRNVLERIENEEALFLSCDTDKRECVSNGLAAWRDFVQDMKMKKGDLKLQLVNDFINKWPYVEDRQNWNKSDYWASPSEFLDKSGDCEDYAIIKYVTLKELGVKSENMRIAVVMDKLRLMYHAVLVVYDDNNQALVMDSLFDAVLPQGDVLQYTPHYSVNEKARWAHVMPVKRGN